MESTYLSLIIESVIHLKLLNKTLEDKHFKNYMFNLVRTQTQLLLESQKYLFPSVFFCPQNRERFESHLNAYDFIRTVAILIIFQVILI